jgi:hypothetical protein
MRTDFAVQPIKRREMETFFFVTEACAGEFLPFFTSVRQGSELLWPLFESDGCLFYIIYMQERARTCKDGDCEKRGQHRLDITVRLSNKTLFGKSVLLMYYSNRSDSGWQMFVRRRARRVQLMMVRSYPLFPFFMLFLD